MSKRLNQDRVKELQPKRMEFAKNEIEKLGYTVSQIDDTELRFLFNGSEIKVFPYSGWFQGKKIKAGRGINKLLNQIKPK